MISASRVVLPVLVLLLSGCGAVEPGRVLEGREAECSTAQTVYSNMTRVGRGSTLGRQLALRLSECRADGSL